jgi:hypothetical protein
MQLVNVVIDCAAPADLAPFWVAATGYTQTWASDDFVVLSAPADTGRANLLLQRVPEPRRGKNRVHVDFAAPDMESEVARLVDLGAARGATHDLSGLRWTVLQDPEGNEFCVAHHPADG